MDHFRVPEPTDEAVPGELLKLFNAASVRWAEKAQAKPEFPEVCSVLQMNKDRAAGRQKSKRPAPYNPTFHADLWFATDFPVMVFALAREFELDDAAMNDLFHVIASVNIPSVSISIPTRVVGGKSLPINRTEACDFISAYLSPLLNAEGYQRWLSDLA